MKQLAQLISIKRKFVLPILVGLALVSGLLISMFGLQGAQASYTGCGYGYDGYGNYGYGYGTCATTTTTTATSSGGGVTTTTLTAPPASVLPASDFSNLLTVAAQSDGSVQASIIADSGTVSITGAAGSLPPGTSISFDGLTASGQAAAAALLPNSSNFVFGFSITWVDSSGKSVNANSPITMTITNPNIKVGDVVWMVDSTGKLINVGTATVAGSVAATFTQDPLFIVAHGATTTTTTSAPPVVRPLRAIRGYGFGVPGRITTMRIVGVGFYGQPRITSTAPGTRVGVTHDYGRQLVLRVFTKAGTLRSTHTFTIMLANGRTCRINYLVK